MTDPDQNPYDMDLASFDKISISAVPAHATTVTVSVVGLNDIEWVDAQMSPKEAIRFAEELRRRAEMAQENMDRILQKK